MLSISASAGGTPDSPPTFLSDVWLSEQTSFHGWAGDSDGEVAVTELPQNGVWAEMPACPCQRRVAVHVLRLFESAGIKQKLNALRAPKRSGAMQRSFASGAAVTHKGTGFNAWLGRRIWIGAVCEQNFDDAVVSQAALGQCSMQRR